MTIFAIAVLQKLQLALMYFVGKAEIWFDGYIMEKNVVTWSEIVIDLCQRFCDKTCSDIIEEFNKLSQKSTVQEYQLKFEELWPHMLQYNPSLSESYFISSFISGLRRISYDKQMQM